MTDTVIQVDRVGKRYVLGGGREKGPYRTLRESLVDAAGAPWRRLRRARLEAPGRAPSDEEFWALRDVSFEVKRGEVVGIIGRNGAGKSTLLKVLSRITEPTTGRITLKGRVASLLEVGTGFHPELTGRENIFLNGAILGMHRHEIKAKFDEIVAFAEVEKFLDTPVKRYSSGMYVRLAFAVAAHLDSEILIVDEVLAVGDAEFQKKSLGRMDQVASREGRTVLFVSHNMGLITQLCSRGVLLRAGQVDLCGSIETVTAAYLNLQLRVESEADLTACPQTHPGFRFKRISLSDGSGVPAASLDVCKPLQVRLEYELTQPIPGLELTLRLINQLGVILFSLNRSANTDAALNIGRYEAGVCLPAEFLVPGGYAFSLFAHVPNKEIIAALPEAISFQLEETGSHMAVYPVGSYGVVLARYPWEERCLTLPPQSQ